MDQKTINRLLVLNGVFLCVLWVCEWYRPNSIFAWFDLRLLTLAYLLFVVYALLKNNK